MLEKTKSGIKKHVGKLTGGSVGLVALLTFFFGYVDRSDDKITASIQKTEAAIYKYVDARNEDVQGDIKIIRDRMNEQRDDIKEQRKDTREIKNILINMQK